jgi:hypothetical protein
MECKRIIVYLLYKLILNLKIDRFRWVFCQLEVLRYCLPSSVRRILDDLPESLDKTYERILREIRKPNQEHALQLLQCLVASARPLKVEELAQVLVFDFDEEGVPKPNLDWRWEDQEKAIMTACSNLVIIVNDGDSRIVQFSHFSVKEFLTAKRLAEPIRDVSRYYIRLHAAHMILVRACLGTLLQFRPHYSDMVKDFPLFFYAARYWDTHALFEDVSSHVKAGIRCLFDANRPHLRAWLYIERPDIYFKRRNRTWMENHGIYGINPSLYVAAELGIYVAAEQIIAEHPEQINTQDEFGLSPIHFAAEAGHLDVLSLLLEHGADVDVMDMGGRTPLHRASLEAKLEAGQCLLDHGADINAPHRRIPCFYPTPLHMATCKGHSDFVRMLLERGAPVDPCDNLRETPLYQAVGKGSTQLVRVLLEYGADINARGRRSYYGDIYTPLNLAIELSMEHPEILELLLLSVLPGL